MPPSPSPAEASPVRAPARPRQWNEVVSVQRRLLREHMLWPITAVISLGIVASAVIAPTSQIAWGVLVLITLAGGLLSVQFAAALGGTAFVSYGTWMFWSQLEYGIGGGQFIMLAFMPFAPLWLAAMRARQRELMHLDALLTLPQVRAAIDISSWSLLPTARALDQRLQAHLALPGQQAPAVLLRLRFATLEQARQLLGQRSVRNEVMRLANILREQLRIGDLIAEDVSNHGSLYVLAFPNPQWPDSLAVVRRLLPVLHDSELEFSIDFASVPQDGDRLHLINWRNSATLE